MTAKRIPEGPQMAPSILSADFARLGDSLETIRAAGIGLVHVDVMDGHFVPNLTIGPPVVAALRAVSDLPFDVHLMIEDPGRWVDDYVKAGADMISVHAEADPHLHRTVQHVRSLGARAGVALNPGTPISAVEDVLEDLDHVLVMSVNPGFGGQSFIPGSIRKLERLREIIRERGLDVRLEVDGGVKVDNVAQLVRAGAELLVAGSAIFGAANPEAAARELQTLAQGAT